jgi:micrococcal nuclease
VDGGLQDRRAGDRGSRGNADRSGRSYSDCDESEHTGTDFDGRCARSVRDGDSIRVTLEGADVPIRLILVDTPEVFGRVDCFGREASAFMTELLPPGTPVFLEKDVSELDAFDRLLRYVYLQDGRMVNELIVSEGYAMLSTHPPDVKHLAVIRAAEDSARFSGRGLWEQCERALEPELEPSRPLPPLEQQPTPAESTLTEPTTVAVQDPTPAPTDVATQPATSTPVPPPTVSEWDAYTAAECAKYQQAYIESRQAGAAAVFLAFIQSKINEWC